MNEWDGNFCRDCKHMAIYVGLFRERWMCGHPEARDPVDGMTRVTCRQQRQPDQWLIPLRGLCGASGRLFESRFVLPDGKPVPPPGRDILEHAHPDRQRTA